MGTSSPQPSGIAGLADGAADRSRGFRKHWTKACKAASIPGKVLHDFRRTAVRNLERAGVPRSVAMKLTGHRTESVHRRYGIVSENDLHVAVERLDKKENAR